MRWLILLNFLWAQELFLTDTTTAFQKARKEKKNLFIYFTATWCGPCRFIEREIWPLLQFQVLTERFVRLKVVAQSGEASTPGSEALRLQYSVKSFPSFVLAEPSGRAYYAWAGLSSIEELEKHLKQAEEVQRGMYQRRFAKGDRDPDFLRDYLKIAFSVRDSARFFPILREYIRAKGSFRAAWKDPELEFFTIEMAQAGGPYSRYIWQNLDSLRAILRLGLYESLGEKLLTNLLDSVWNLHPLPAARNYCDSIAKAYEPLFPSARLVSLRFVSWKLIESEDSLARREGFLMILRYLWRDHLSQIDTLRDTTLLISRLIEVDEYVNNLLDESPPVEVLWTLAALMREAVLRMPAVAFFWSTLGDVYKTLREKNAALHAYRTALQKMEDHPLLEYPRLRISQKSPTAKQTLQKKIQEVEAWSDF
ncbi:MAG: thioredoxin family protein [Bacteroidia bacterium]|nr:thioredoxin family protein [Bacteroidia bacterium]